MTDPPAAAPTSDSTAGPRLVIWGTDVVVQETQEKFKKFLQEFIDENAEGMGDDFVPNEPLYMQKLEEVNNIFHSSLCPPSAPPPSPRLYEG